MNVKSHRQHRSIVAATLGVVALSSAQSVMAATGTWSPTPTDSNWPTTTNWVGGTVGGTVNTLNNDTVTFNSALATDAITGNLIGSSVQPILNDVNRSLKFLVFDSNAGPYTLGTVGGNTLRFNTTKFGGGSGSTTAADFGSISVNAGVTQAQTINAPIRLALNSSNNGYFNLINNSTTTGASLFVHDIFNESANTRPMGLTLDGSNTGANTIGQIFDNVAANGAIVLTKNGAGTWILAGANELPQKTSAGTVAAAFINAGTLVAQNAGSLGSYTQGNLNVTGTGTLRLDAIGLSNAGLTLNGTGTVLANGTSSVNAVAVNAAATDVNLNTTNSGDVFSVNGVVSGAAPAATVHVAGPGTVILGAAGTYTGTFSVDAGTLRVSNATGLGTAAAANVKFGTGSTGVLQLNGVNSTIVGLQGTATGTAVESSSGSSTLTVNNAAANQYGGTLRDGAGQLSLTKGAAGVLALTGANTFTGAVTVTNGSLLANNASGSATGTANTVTASGNAIIGGNGTIASAVNLNANAHLAPGATAGQVGTLHVGSLTLGASTNLDYDITSTAVLDQTIVDNVDGLTINGGTLNINGGASALTVNGVYNLIGYTGNIGGIGTGALAINAANTSPATNSYIFGSAGGYVTLTIASTGATINYWNADANGNWSTGPWTPAEPNAVGAFASFGGGGTPITADRTITVDAPKTVGTLAFNNAAGKSYTIAGSSPITLNGGTGITAFITDSAGSHTISAPLNLVTNGTTVTVTGAADKLSVSGIVSGAGSAITKLGAGTLALTGVNTYDAGTNLNAGTIQINSADSLGASTGNLDFAGGTLQLLADVTAVRNYTANTNDADVKLDTNGFNLTQNGNILAAAGGTGGLVKTGAGTLTLTGTNTYVGATTISAGTLSIGSNANLGDTVAAAGLNLASGTTLVTTGTFNATNRPVSIGAGGVTIDVADTTAATLSGAVTGGTITKNNTGNLILTNTGNTTPMIVNAGTVTAGGTTSFTNGGFGSGAITLQGGATLAASDTGTASILMANAITIPTGQVGNLNTSNRFTLQGNVTGGGTLNFNASSNNTTYTNISNNFTGFTGTLNVGTTNATNTRLLVNGGGFNLTGLSAATLNLDGNGFLQLVSNSNGNTVVLGALSGAATAGITGGTAGAATYQVGGLNTSTTYAGTLSFNTNLTKVGTGTLTLTGANSHTGVIAVNAGTLAINGTNTLSTGALTFAGGTLQYTPNFTAANNGSGDISIDSNNSVRPVTFAAGGATIDTNGNDVLFSNAVGNAGAGGLTKRGAGTLTLNGANTYTGATTVIAGVIKANSNAYTPILANTTSGADLQGGKLLLDYSGGGSSPVAQIKTLLDNEYLTNGGNFTTGQVRSTTAAANGKTLGYGDDAAGTVTIMYTLAGDSDLNGQVNFDDFLILQNNFSQPGTRFDQGNFNYDGQTDFTDFLALQNNFGQSVTGTPTTITASEVAALTAFANSPASLVPEPATLAVVGLGGLLLGRRRRQA